MSKDFRGAGPSDSIELLPGRNATLVRSLTSSSAIAERPRCRVGSLWPKVGDWNWETVFYGHYRSIFNYCDVIVLASKTIKFDEKRKIRTILCRSRSFKVIEVGSNRKPVCFIYLVIDILVTDILSRTVS